MKTLLILALAAAPAYAGDVSEAELFSGEDMMTAPAAAAPAEEKKTLGLSGELTAVAEDLFYSTGTSGVFNSYMKANLLMDARLKGGVKAFANLEATYTRGSAETESSLRELFLDFNLDRRVYFRAGKQVLQWGRCSLWNPTDLINVEKNPFIRRIGYREGAYGLKAHMPFGAAYNLYAFADLDARDDRDPAGALKFEFLTGATEMAFSGWARRHRRPVLGYDISSRVGDVDVAGELSVSRRDNTVYARERGGTLYAYRKNREWTPRAALTLSRGFRVGNFNDRLTVSAETFYNANGYTRSPFRDGRLYAFTGPLAALLPAGTRGQFLVGSGLYEPNYMARHYAALFTTVTRFIVTDMTLSANYIRNLNDSSGAASAGVNYRNLQDFSAGFLATAFTGPAKGEYTWSGARLLLQLTAGIVF